MNLTPKNGFKTPFRLNSCVGLRRQILEMFLIKLRLAVPVRLFIPLAFSGGS